MSVRTVEADGLELGGGLEVLLEAALVGCEPGGCVDVVTPSRATALELPAWARLRGHRVVAERREADRHRLRLERGTHSRVLAPPPLERSAPPPLVDGVLRTRDMRAGRPTPPAADPAAGFVPVGAVAESGGPRFDWRVNEREEVWADDVAELVEQANGAHWDAGRDIPWEAARDLPDHLERAVAQVMTFIAQNEYAALYVPAGFLPHLNPEYAEVMMWLASHVHDEARHVEVFTKRALIGGESGYALAATELSLHSLLEEHDFTAASLLLNVLGEGTFLDLLRFVEHHAPDAATEAAAALAHRDEVRHVHFGVSHVRRRIEHDPDSARALVSAAEGRAAKLTELSGLSPLLTEGLTVMAAGSLQPAELSEGAAAVKALTQTMEENRVRRLRAAGFDESAARYISALHTPNLM